MRTPIYKSRPVAPAAARLGGERINDFIVMSEGSSNTYLLETSDGSILINSGMAFEAPVHHRNYSDLSSGADDIRYVITTAGPEPAAERQSPLDHEHYVQKQVRAVAEPVLTQLGLDFDRVIGDEHQLRLF